MLSIKNIILTQLIFTFSVQAFAKLNVDDTNEMSARQVQILAVNQINGTEVGNGGLSVVCGSDRVFLDYYNYKSKGPVFHLDKYYEGQTLDAIVRALLKSYKSVDKEFSETLLANSMALISKLGRAYVDYKASPVENLPTPVNLPFPYGCKTEQIIFHNHESGRNSYAVNFAAFLELDSLNQAIAIIHEAIYMQVDFKTQAPSYENLVWFTSQFTTQILDSTSESLAIGRSTMATIKYNHQKLIERKYIL